MIGAIVETGDVGKVFAASAAENIRILKRDLLQRFQTVHGKAWADDIYTVDALFGQKGQSLLGVGGEPWCTTKA